MTRLLRPYSPAAFRAREARRNLSAFAEEARELVESVAGVVDSVTRGAPIGDTLAGVVDAAQELGDVANVVANAVAKPKKKATPKKATKAQTDAAGKKLVAKLTKGRAK